MRFGYLSKVVVCWDGGGSSGSTGPGGPGLGGEGAVGGGDGSVGAGGGGGGGVVTGAGSFSGGDDPSRAGMPAANTGDFGGDADGGLGHLSDADIVSLTTLSDETISSTVDSMQAFTPSVDVGETMEAVADSLSTIGKAMALAGTLTGMPALATLGLTSKVASLGLNAASKVGDVVNGEQSSQGQSETVSVASPAQGSDAGLGQGNGPEDSSGKEMDYESASITPVEKATEAEVPDILGHLISPSEEWQAAVAKMKKYISGSSIYKKIGDRYSYMDVG